MTLVLHGGRPLAAVEHRQAEAAALPRGSSIPQRPPRPRFRQGSEPVLGSQERGLLRWAPTPGSPEDGRRIHPGAASIYPGSAGVGSPTRRCKACRAGQESPLGPCRLLRACTTHCHSHHLKYENTSANSKEATTAPCAVWTQGTSERPLTLAASALPESSGS